MATGDIAPPAPSGCQAPGKRTDGAGLCHGPVWYIVTHADGRQVGYCGSHLLLERGRLLRGARLLPADATIRDGPDLPAPRR